MKETMKVVTTSVGGCVTSVGLVLAEHPLIASMVVAYFTYHYSKRLQVRN